MECSCKSSKSFSFAHLPHANSAACLVSPSHRPQQTSHVRVSEAPKTTIKWGSFVRIFTFLQYVSYPLKGSLKISVGLKHLAICQYSAIYFMFLSCYYYYFFDSNSYQSYPIMWVNSDNQCKSYVLSVFASLWDNINNI